MNTAPSTEPVKIRAHDLHWRRLGHWTASRRFDVRASGSSVTLDLRSPRIADGDIEITVDLDRSMLKLLVPDGARLDLDDVRRVGRCGHVDWSGSPAPGGPVIRLGGEICRSEIRVNRGGIAILAAMLTGEYVADLRRAFKESGARSLQDVQAAYAAGRWTTVENPGRAS